MGGAEGAGLQTVELTPVPHGVSFAKEERGDFKV